jgi:hypothetical protein
MQEFIYISFPKEITMVTLLVERGRQGGILAELLALQNTQAPSRSISMQT